MESDRMHPVNLPRVLIVVSVMILAVYLLVGWLLPPSLFNDLAAGWQVWISMKHGAPFNCEWVPDAQDVSRMVPFFQAWWSPGQYLLPAVLTGSGLSLGHAVVILGVMGNGLGLAGYWRLWRTWGISSELAAWSGLVVVGGRAFGSIIGVANLADVFLFAAVPWVALLVWRWRALGKWACVWLTVFICVGMGLKLAFLISGLAMLTGVVADAVWRQGGRLSLKLGGFAARAGLVFVVARLAWDWGYLRHGYYIQPAHGLVFENLAEVFMPWGGPFLSAFGGGNFLGRVFLFPGYSLLGSEMDLGWFYLASAALTAAAIVWLWRSFPSKTYVVQVSAWLAVYGLVFMVLYTSGAAVSLDERHFRGVGLLLLPGLLAWLRSWCSQRLRVAGYAAVAGLCLYGMASVVVNAMDRARFDAEGRWGFMHTELTKGALAELHRLDGKRDGRTLFYVSKPEIALEVEHGRVMCIPLDSWGEEMVKAFTYRGRTERLILVLPVRDRDDGKLALAKGAFPDYSVWDVAETDGFLFVTGR